MSFIKVHSKKNPKVIAPVIYREKKHVSRCKINAYIIANIEPHEYVQFFDHIKAFKYVSPVHSHTNEQQDKTQPHEDRN